MKSVAILAVAASLAFAQPAIEVASVKPGDPGATAMGNHFASQQFTLMNYALMSLIEDAWNLREYQILSAPGWLRSERWTLEIKTTVPTNFQQKSELLRPLLADRFQLKFHRETRSMPVYSLVIAPRGPKFRAAEDNAPGGFSYNGNQVRGKKYDIRMLAGYLSGGVLNRPVIDKTGLTGNYDIDLKWTPDPNLQDFGDVHNPADLPAPDPNRPEIFTAIREQLGLELKAEKGPVDVIVIDRVERPTPN